MKKCQNCGAENADEMNFCGDCGARLKNQPQMVVPLETIQSLPDTEDLTESLSAETETIPGNRYQPPSVPTLSIRQPQSNKKIFAVFGVLFAAFFLVIAAAGAMIYFYIQSPDRVITAKPTPTPKKTPEELIFTPPDEPTRQGSFTIGADEEDWQLSDIETVPSETFRTEVRGTIDLDEIGADISPEGVESDKDRRIYKKYPTGALLMRTRFADGETSNIQPVAAADMWENAPDERGRLEFLINDNSPENNRGEFSVSVTLIRVP